MAVWWHLSAGPESSLDGTGLVGQEVKAGQGCLSSWEGRSKGRESRDGSTQERIICPYTPLPFLLLLPLLLSVFALLEFIQLKLKGAGGRKEYKDSVEFFSR